MTKVARDNSKLRTALIAELAKRSSAGVGRTALMKLVYFLQTLRGAELGYSFRLYTYGPYDSQVLEDLKIAEAFGGVQSEQFEWQGGSGYEIRPGSKADQLTSRAGGSLKALSKDIDWVMAEFSSRSASDLEVASTIIYVDRDVCPDEISISGLAKRVHSIKRHHSLARIETEVRRLVERGMLEAVAT